MENNDGAGAGQDDGQDGSGAPSGGSPEGGSENDEKPITAKQLKAALESQKRHYEGRLDNQRAEFEAFKEGVGKQPQARDDGPKTYTRSDLKAAVDAGQITQVQADDIWDRQRDAQTLEQTKATVLEVVSAKTTQQRVEADLDKYKRLAPEIMDTSSAVRAKVAEEFKYLVDDLGDPRTTKTELKAIRAVLGPLEKLEVARSTRRTEDHEQQSGGGGGSGRKTGKKLVDQLSERQRSHYQKGIDTRRYKDWSEVEAELSHAPQRVGRA